VIELAAYYYLKTAIALPKYPFMPSAPFGRVEGTPFCHTVASVYIEEFSF
jgi:hypothetical protein